MKTNQNTLIILGIILVVVVVGGWYFINQSSASSQNVATTTSATVTSTGTGTAAGKSSSGHSATSVSTSNSSAPTTGTSAVVPPQIIEFNPASGSAGTQVTISGTNFSRTANYVTFGSWGGRYHADGSPDNQIAVVASNDGTEITFTVPSTGPSGQLCNSDNQCIEVSAVLLSPGNYPVTVRTVGGTSNTKDFTVSK